MCKFMQILHHFIQQTWTSGDFGVYKGPGTSPPQIRRDNCIVVIYFLFNPSLLNTKLLVLLVKKQQLELDMELLTGSKLEKEYIKAVYCHPAYLPYMQSTSCKMLGWMKHKLESRLWGEISMTSDMQMTPPIWQKVKRN